MIVTPDHIRQFHEEGYFARASHRATPPGWSAPSASAYVDLKNAEMDALGVAQLANLKVTFGKAHDFNTSGNRAYFVLPTHWQGKCPLASGPFEESGAWVFVLAKRSGQRRITGYAWGVYQSTYEAD